MDTFTKQGQYPFNKKYYTVEYSVQQKCLHIDELDNILKLNYRKTLENTENQFSLIGIFETIEEADNFADNFRRIKEKI